MQTAIRSFVRRFPLAVLLGAASGTVFLGVGGRLVMYVFARATVRTAGFTLGGTISVIVSGIIAGAIGGALFALTERFLTRRPWARGVLFAALCYLIATPGFRPPQPLVFALFAPVFLGYAVLLSLVWDRVARRDPPVRPTTP